MFRSEDISVLRTRYGNGALQHQLYLVYSVWRAPTMCERMAVGAKRDQIRSGINDVVLAKFRDGRNVMDLDQPGSRQTVSGSHVPCACFADVSMNSEGCRPVPSVAFVPVHEDSNFCSFG